MDNEARSRFELVDEGQVVAVADYHPTKDVHTFLLPHTHVEVEHRGRGLGAVLVAGALDQLRSRGLKVVPQCWFVAEFIDSHPEYADLRAS